MDSEKPHVAYLGLGAMGSAMSTHLVRESFPVTGFDIYTPTLERWSAACQKIKDSETPNASFSSTTSVTKAVRSTSPRTVDVIVLMVATHSHVESALFDDPETIKSIPQGCPLIVMATIPPTYMGQMADKIANQYKRPDILILDAPVSGGTVRSADGTLTVMVTADPEKPEIIRDPRVQTVLKAVSSAGNTLFSIPGSLGSGSATKALNQVQCGIHIVAGSEIMALAALVGLNTQHFFESFQQMDKTTGKNRLGYTWMLNNRGPRMLDNDLPLSSAISIINKDVGIIHDEQARLRCDLPMVDLAYEQLAITMQSDIAKWDDAWISKWYLDPSLQNKQKQEIVVDATKIKPKIQNVDDLEQTVLHAHALINLCSAYETMRFAAAQELLGEVQRKMWFTLIAGAAGGSTVFSEVIPMAFSALENDTPWETGFRAYAESILTRVDTQAIRQTLEQAISSNPDFKPLMAVQALQQVEGMAGRHD